MKIVGTVFAALGFAFAAMGASPAGLLPAEVGLGWTNGWVAAWVRDVPGLTVADTTVREREGRVKVVRRWTWHGKAPLERVTLGVRYHMAGDTRALKPFIPGVLLYGNPSNAGRRDGRVSVYAGEPDEFAIFEEHRLPMPFALLEHAQTGDFTALHVLPSPVRGAAREDLWWSVGVEAKADGADLVMLSGPVGYNRRRSVVKALQRGALPYDNTYITLSPGQVVEKTFWIQTGRASNACFGFERALGMALELFPPYDLSRYARGSEIVSMKRAYALTRWVEDAASGGCGFNMMNPATGQRFLTVGWCGCAVSCAYALPVLDFDPADWTKAQRALDFLSDRLGRAKARPDGLFPATIRFPNLRMTGGDPVSCGQGLYCILKAIRFAEHSKGRLDAAKWRAFADRTAGNISRAILAPDWRAPHSTGPGFLIAPLVLASDIFGREEYLRAALKLAESFAAKYTGYDHVYWGGTLDASCEDKEGAMAAFQGYVAILKHAVKTKDAALERRYARLATHALHLMLTYTMIWDATYPPGRLSDHAFKSTGWTVVSAQNQHLDAFGVLATPDIWWMGDYLKDARYKTLAKIMYRSCFQLTDSAGSLGEQIQHTNFAQQGDMSDVRKLRGGYSEHWTVLWLTAHFLNAAAEFKEMGVSLDE